MLGLFCYLLEKLISYYLGPAEIASSNF
jgi:hypothetical protein